MKLGAEPKKIGILVALVAVALYFFLSGRSSDAPSTAAPRPQQQAAARPASPEIERPSPPVARGRKASASREFRPRLGGGKNAIDPTTIDPTLRLDLLAKVQSVKMEGNARNLFQFGPAPAPKVPEVKVVPKPIAPAVAAGSMGQGSVANGLPPKPPPPAIPLKFYGYMSKNRAGGDRRAFFIEGDEIFVAGEGEVIKQRYKVMRIGVNSAVVQDTQFSHEQTLPLEEQAG